MGLGAAGVALAVPLPSLPVSRPVGCWWVLWRFPSLPPRWRLLAPALPLRCLSAPLFLPPGLGLAVPPGLVLGCCPWLPLPLDTVFWFSGGECRRVWLLVAGGLFGVVLLKNWAQAVWVCP